MHRLKWVIVFQVRDAATPGFFWYAGKGYLAQGGGTRCYNSSGTPACEVLFNCEMTYTLVGRVDVGDGRGDERLPVYITTGDGYIGGSLVFGRLRAKRGKDLGRTL